MSEVNIMEKYHAVCDTDDEMRDLLAIIRGVNNEIIAEPSGYGDRIYIAIVCTPDEYAEIARRWLI